MQRPVNYLPPLGGRKACAGCMAKAVGICTFAQSEFWQTRSTRLGGMERPGGWAQHPMRTQVHTMSDEPAWSWHVCQNMYLETVGSLWVRCGSRLIVFDPDSPESAPIGPDWPGLAWQIGLDLTQKHCGGFAVGSLR